MLVSGFQFVKPRYLRMARAVSESSFGVLIRRLWGMMQIQKLEIRN